MSKSSVSRPITGASFTLEALEPRLLLSATSLPEPEVSQPDTGSTSVLALAGVGHADLLSNPSENGSADLFGDYLDTPRLVLTSATLKNYEGQEDTIFGTSDLLTQVVVGDGTDAAVYLPGQNSLIYADSVDVNAPLVAQNLVITGDGSTVKLNNTITSVTNIINDSVEVSGNFGQSPVRTITSTGGVLTINGTLNGDNHAGAVGTLNENGGVDDVVLNATGALFIRDAVGGISGNGLRHISINITGADAGNVTFNDTVTISGNLYIKKGQDVSFLRNVVIGGDLVIEDAADVRFDGTLTIGGSLRIMKAGNVTFAGNVAVTGNVTLGRPDLLANIGSVSFTSSARLDLGGHGAIYTAGNMSFGNNVGESVSLRPDSLTLAAGGNITFASSSSVLLDTTTPFVISKAVDISFGSNINTGNLTIGQGGNVTGNVTFSGASVSVQSLDVTTSGALGRVSVINNVTVGGGNATITANEVNFGGSATLTSTGFASTLTLKPYDVARAIAIGTSATGAPASIDDRLDLNGDDIKAILPTFAQVIFGDLYAGTGNVFVGNVGSVHSSHQFLNRTTIAGGAVTLTQNLDVATSADYLRIVARTGNITVNGVVNRGAANGSDLADETFAERNAWIRLEAAGDIIVNRAVYAATRISLTAGTDGTGGITVNSTGSNSGALQTINTAAGAQRIELVAGETSGNITFVDDIGATTLRAAGSASSIVLRANGGAISQTEGLLVANTLSVWARDNVGLRTDVNQIASQTINGEILPGGTGAQVTANMVGQVTTIFLTNGGSGYTSAPTVTLSAPSAGGTQATATATVVGGFVTAITITNAGIGYATAPTVSFSGGGGSGAAALALVTPGALASLTIAANGAGFTATPTLTVIGDGRSVATGAATIRGTIGSYLITSGGSSYTSVGFTILGGATVGSTFNVIPGQLTGATVVAPGGPYSTAPSVTVSGDGTGAAVTALLNANLFSVSSTSGAGYTYTPTVVVTGGAANQTINGLQIVGGGSVNIVNSGGITVANATTTPNSASTRGAFSLTTLAGDIALGYVNTSTGAITLTAAGAITDSDSGSESVPNLVTTGLVSLAAATGIGAYGGADIDVTAGSLQATNSTSGNIVIQHVGLTGLAIAGTGVQTLGGNGSINIQSNALNSNTGTLTVAAPVSAHGSGNIRLQATGSLSDIVLSTATADLTSGTGHITLVAERNLTTAAGTRLDTVGGSIFLEASTGVLTMADDSLATSGGGAIRAIAQSDVTLGGLQAGSGSVSVISTGASILDAGDTHRDIIGGLVRLAAFSGVGTAANPLEISAATLSASAAAAGINLRENDDVTIGATANSTNRVNLDGSVTAQADASQSDLATSLNGSVNFAASGTITLVDGDADNHAVSASGTGLVYLSAGVSIDAQSDVVSGSGSISILAGNSISFAAGSDVTTAGSGTIDLLATTGSITQANGSVASTAGGSLRAQAGADLTVASFNVGSGNISIIAGGSILDGGDSVRDLVANAARLVAGNAAGAAANALETTLGTLSVSAGAGGINIAELDALLVDSVAVTVNRVNDNQTTTALPDAAQADLVTTDDGSIKVVTGGDLTLNKGDGDDDSVAADGAGSITLETTGVITMSDGAIATTGTGAVNFTATGSIHLSIVISASGDFTITSDAAITDNLTGEATNLRTSGLAALDAHTGVGAIGDADIDTDVGSITARNRTSGDIVIEEADAVTIAAAGLVNNVAAAHVILSTLAGTITVGGPVTATGSGRIRLSAAGASSDIIGSTAISTGTGGHVTLLAARSLTLNTGASVAALGAGTLDLEATTGSITFADNVAATTGSGNIRLLAAQNVALTGLATTGSVTVQATAGSISDSGETLRDIVAASARLNAAVGIGATGALETTIGTLAASATTGGVAISELNDLVIGSVAALSVNRVALDATLSSVGDAFALTDVEATTGDVTISAGGALTLTDGSDADARAVETTTGDISLSAVNNVTFQASVVSTSGDITAASSAAALVDDTADENALVVTTGLATLNAATGVGTAGAGDIDTTVTFLRGVLSTSGGFFVEETNALVVHEDGIVTQGGNAPVSLVVTTGALTVDGVITAHGSGNIHVNAVAGPAGVNADVSSTSGHVTFLANGTIELNADIASGLTGTLNVVSATGSITQLDGTRVRTGSGDIRLLASGSIALAGLSTTGDASVTATTGAITDAGDTHVDAIANQLRLTAGTSIATSANHLETTVATISASAGGNIYLLESDGVTVDDTQSTVQVVAADTTAVATASEGTQSDLVTTNPSNGNIVLRSTSGDIVLNDGTAGAAFAAVTANGSGNVLIDALAGSLDINSAVRSSTGHVTLKADDNIDIAAGTYVYTASAGTVSIDAEAGFLLMGGTTSVTADGSSARLRAQLDITVGNVTATNVSIDSDAGSIINAAGSTKNVTATNLRLQASGSIGVPGRHLTTNIANVSALASTGSIYVTEDNGATVRDVEVAVTDFNFDATTTVVTDVSQSDFVTGANGNIVLVATLGDITLTDALDADDVAVTANGSGNILIDALAGSLFVNAAADIRSGTGHITLKADDNITLAANVDVATASTGTVSLDAETGFLLMDGSADILAADSSARLRATGNITVGNITADDVSILSTAGAIINAADSAKNVTAENLRLQSVGSIGVSGRHLTTDIDNVTALSTTGSIFITEDDAAIVREVAVSVTDFTSTAGTTVVTDNNQSDLTTGANGHIVLVATLGDITLNDGHDADNIAATANGTGSILIDALAGSITANADILSGTGHITLKADDNIDLTSEVDIATASAGTVSLDAETGALTMHGTADILASGSSVRLRAEGNITVGNVTAAHVSIDSDEGGVINAALSTKNVTATNLRLQAENSIGASDRHLTTNITNVTALAETGSIFITEDDAAIVRDVTVTVTDFTSTAGTTVVTDDNQSDLTTGANGHIVLIATLGDITLNDGHDTDNIAVTANGTGNILIDAVAGGITANADILSGTGHITLLAQNTITLTALVDVTTTGSGTQDLVATTGSFIMSPTATLNTVNGDIRVTVGDDVLDQVVIGDITASNANVSIVTTGSVLDADAGGDSDIDVIANGLRIDAGKGVGLLSGNSLTAAVNALETTVGTLSAIARGSDGINLTETDALAINDVVSLTSASHSVSVQTVAADATTSATTEVTQSDLVTTATNGANGSIVVRTLNGTITLSEGTATADLNADAAIVAHGTGNILVQAVGAGTSITANANADIETTTGHITLKAAQNITLGSELDVITGTPGTISLNALAGFILMDGTADILATGSSARLRAELDITVGNITAANVSIDSDDGSILNAAGSTKNVTAQNLRLQAENSIGEPENHLTTDIDNVSALASTGSIYVTEDDGVTVQNVTVTVQDVIADSTVTPVVDDNQSDLTTGSNGNIVLIATLGDITLNDGTAPAGGAAVSANGTGNILIDSVAGSITANADILSGTGHITLLAQNSINLTANVDVTTTGVGTMDIGATTGSFIMSPTATLNTVNGDIRVTVGDDVLDQVVIGDITASNANVSIVTTGSVLDADDATLGDDSDIDITARGLRIDAGKGAGLLFGNSLAAPVNAIETTVDTVSVHARGSDGINITETDAVAVDTIISQTNTAKSVSVQTVGVTGATTESTEDHQADLVTSSINGANGSIVLRNLAGDITLNDGIGGIAATAITAHGAGNILVDALDGTLTANADIRSTTGHVTLKAEDDINLTANVDVTTSSAGTISLNARTGALTMHGSATVVATDSSARLRAQLDITVGNITATNVSIDSDAGSIINAAGSTKNVTADNLRLQAQNSIGASDRHLTTDIDILSAAAATGSIFITEDDGVTVQNVTVTVQDVIADSTVTPVVDVAQSDLTTGANGNIVLVATLGDITLNDGTAPAGGNAVVANGTGNILIDSVAGSITANADIRSGTGHITLLAQNSITLTAGVDVTTTGVGTLDIGATTGSFTMSPTATLNTVNGDIRVTAGNDFLDQVVIGDITASNANVSIVTTGSVLDADTGGDSDIDVTARGLRIDAGKGVGLLAGNSLTAAVNAIETTVATLSVIARGSDGINVTETDALAINDVVSLTDGTKSVSVETVQADATTDTTTEVTQSDLVTTSTNGANGSIVLRTLNGTITLSEGTATADLNTDATIVAHGSGNVLVQAVGASTDIIALANADIESTTGHLTLKAARTINLAANVDVTTTGSGTQDLVATTGSLVMATTATLNTVNGDIRVTVGNDALDQVVIGDITASNANVSIVTTGSVLDADDATAGDDTDIDITARGLRIDAGKGVGLLAGNSLAAPVNAIETTVASLSAIARGSDGINVTETDALAINDVISLTDGTKSVSVQTVQADATTATTTEVTQSDLVTTATNGANGSIVLRTLGGDITLSEGTATADLNTDAAIVAHGSGNILVQAIGANTSITAQTNADIESTTGHITLKAAQNITLDSELDVITGTPGTISLNAIAGFILMDGTADILASGSSARLRAQGDITVGNVTAANVSIDSDAGSIINATGSTKNVTATNLRLQASGSIGTSARHLTTNIDNVSALTSTGSIYLTEDNAATVRDVTVTVQDVLADSTVTAVNDAAQSDLTTSANGNIVLVATLGDITLNDGADADNVAVSANGTGSILIDSVAGSITANAAADIRSGTGHITLKADDNITLNANVDIATASTGTVSIDAETGFLLMSGTANVTATSSSARLRAQGDITVGNITATNVSIDSDAGSIINAASSTKNVTATNLRLQASGSIGTSARHLTTNIDNVSALASTGSIYLTEDNAATVRDVAVTVTNFTSTAGTTTTADAAQSDLTTSANGNIVLVATLGDITLNDGADADNLAVTANGTGSILIDSVAGSITANASADLRSGTGHITLKADDNITLAANVDVATAAAGTVSIDAETGFLLMSGTANVTATSSSARLRAQGDITVGNITATNVSIDSDAGSIINAASSTKNVTATNLRLQASGSIGTSTRHLTTNIDNVSALASTGSIYLTEDNAAIVRDVAVTVTNFTSTAGTTTTADAAQSDLTTGANGNIVLVATLGDITLNDGADADNVAVTANGTGNILIDSVAGSITANADLLSGTGHITLKAYNNITLTANVDVATGTAGTIFIDAEDGALTMAGSATVVATSSSARLRAQGNITVGNVTATNVSIDSDGGSIINAASSSKNVTATNLRLQANGSIGVSGRHISTNIDNLSAYAVTGSLYVTEDNGVTVGDVAVTVTEFTSIAGTFAINDLAQSDLTTGPTSNGNIVLVATLGNIVLNDGSAPAAGNAVVANGSGSILMDALAGSLTANADLRSTTGHITLKAAQNITLNTNVDVVTISTGTVSINAVAGSLTMSGTANVTATSSSARLRAQGDITVGNVTATNVSIDSDAGSIINAASSTKNVTATNLRLQASGSIGTSARHLTTNIDNLSALASTGSIYLTEDNAATVRDVAVTVTNFTSTAGTTTTADAAQSDLTTSTNGNIVLVATLGDITLNDGADADNVAVTANGTGSILIDSVAGSITANADLISGTGHVSVLAQINLTLNATADITTAGAGTVYLDAATGAVTQADNSRVTTANGDIRVNAATNLTVGGITTAANVSLLAGSGSIIDAGDAFGGADIVASGLRVVAGIGIGSGASPLETTIGTFAARATSGGIHVRETDAVILGAVSATVQQVGSTAAVTPVADASLAGVQTTAGNGVLDLRTTAGAITVANASGTHGSGAINLVAGGATGNVVFADILSTTTGAVSVTAGARIRETTTAEVPVIVTGGVLALDAVTGIGETGRADLDVSAPSLSFVNGGGGQVYLKSHSADATLTGATLADAGSLIFIQVSGGLDITGPVNVAAGTATFRVPGALTLTNAPISAAGGMTLQAVSLSATASDLTSTSGLLRVSAADGVTLDAASSIDGADVLLVSSGNIALAQVDATGLLDIRAGGNVSTVDPLASLAAAQLRLAVGGDAGAPSSPLRVESDASDVTVAGSINIVYLNGLNLGRGGIDFDTDEGDEQVIVIEGGGTIGTIGGDIVDHGSGTLLFESDGSLALAAQIISVGGDIVIDAQSITDASPDEAALLSAANGRITLIADSGIGATGAGDIDFVSSEIVGTTQTGDLQLEALGSVSVVDTGLVIGSAAATGSIGLTVSTGNLFVPAAVTNAGSGGISLLVPAGTFTMSNLQPITTGTGPITIESLGTMSVGRIVSTSGFVSLTTQDSITTVALLNFPNITILESVDSALSPAVSFSTSINIIIAAYSVYVTTPYLVTNYPEFFTVGSKGYELLRDGSDDIDMSVYSDGLTGN